MGWCTSVRASLRVSHHYMTCLYAIVPGAIPTEMKRKMHRLLSNPDLHALVLHRRGLSAILLDVTVSSVDMTQSTPLFVMRRI
jgi:hypothetical protein